MRKLKGIVLGWIYRVAALLPPRLAIWVVNRSWPWGRPVLDYVELHLTDHCNLNCAGCSHFAPYADQRFADIDQIQKDFVRLRALFSNVRHVRIMGGEPLLHPQAADCVRLARESFPKSKIRLVTNGIRLLERDNAHVLGVLASLRESRVGIDWTMYPPLAKRRDDICRLCEENGVNLRISENNSFLVRMKPQGNASAADSFRWCRKLVYCPILDNGRLYLCAQSHYVRYYNRVAGTHIVEDKGIDIHSASAREILFYLMRPSPACAFCAPGMRCFDWKNEVRPEDWWL